MFVMCGVTDDEDGGMLALLEWCARQDRPVTFRPVDLDAAGGDRRMQVAVYACAMNCASEGVEALAAAFPAFPWTFPDEAVLVVYPDEGPPLVVRGTEDRDH
jgi:hypothetical protein